jgi:hypothetical protein
MTPAEYDALLEQQGGVCAICWHGETARNQYKRLPLAVDHDHENGKIRGLLCMRCNRSLGMLREDPEVLAQMLDYLDEHREPSKQPLLYLAGPMSGYELLNFPAFDAARDRLSKLGFKVLSPADHDREAGLDPADDESPLATLFKKNPVARQNFIRRMMKWDLRAVGRVDFVYFLKGWEKSRGARAEYAAACFYRDLCGDKPGLMFEPGAAMGLDFTPMSLTVNPSNADINAIAAGILAKVASDPSATAKDLDGQLVVSVSALVQSVNVTFDNGTYSVGITHTDGQDVTLTASVNF